MEDYKIDIQNTRKGCVGGSDAKMLQAIAEQGAIPKSALRRLAVCKGLADSDNVTNRAMQYGDFIEQSIFNHLAEGDMEYESNPLWISEKYSKPNVKLISHPDIIKYDSKTHTIFIYEVKATKFGVESTIETYRGQMYIEYLLGHEKALKCGKNWNVRVFLVHYNSCEQDMGAEFEFHPEEITIREVEFNAPVFDVQKAMNIISEFLKTYDKYEVGEEVDGAYLPEEVKKEFDTITTYLSEIKEREAKVEEFKKKLCAFMEERGIKSVKNDLWSITYIAPTESVSVDYKTLFTKEVEAKKPRVAKKLKEQYRKVTKKGAFVQIRLNNKTND